VRLSLRWKIVGGFGIVLALIALLGWVTLSLFGSLRSIQRRVFDDAIPGLVTVEEIVRSYTAQSAAVRGYLIGGQPALLDQYRSEVATSDFWERRADRLFTSNDERTLLVGLKDSGEQFQQLVEDQVVPLTQRGMRSQAFRVLGQEGTPLISEIERLGGLLREAQDKVMVRAESDLQDRSNTTVLILLVVTVGSLAVGVFLAVVLPRRLSANLGRLVEAARAVGRGDLDQPIEITSRDEIGELAERFSEMQVGLKRLQQLALQDRELEIASQIQKNLLQRSMPDAPGVRLVPLQRQANLVGGDWYDVDFLGRRLTVAVGDASGKGIAAALMATVALAALRAERGRGASTRQIIETANRSLKDAADVESFTTLVYLTLDVRTGEAHWVNMGHHSPFLLKASPADGGDRRGYYLEGPRNRALGWFDDPGMAETLVRLSRGDRLFLFTDGFLEAKSPDGEVFGEHRLADALLRLGPLDPALIGDELVGEVERFAAGKLDDDLTILVIEWQGTETSEDQDGGEGTTGEEGDWHSRR
jgi:serine phosphatase RsbU (regulator of sigma subunit)/CHASE3 domain sensor protein